MPRSYQICSRCVLDTTDPDIEFDAEGVCSHCRSFDNEISKHWHPDEHGARLLADKVAKIKAAGRGKRFDCIMGLSGGVDSSYLALKTKELGLRPLVVHVDAGWNSELAVHNIERIIEHCGFELYTHVLNWNEVRDLQLAYLKSGVANQDVVQDHGFFATLYHFAVKEKIKYVLNGGNIATESVFPRAWHHAAMDAINLRAIHRQFGAVPLKEYRTISFFEYYIYYPMILGMEVVRPLNFMPYNKSAALQYLKATIGYKEYGRKHGESVFTKFFQNYYLPKRFGYDKRRPHLASMILSGQVLREDALRQLEEPLYEPEDLHRDREYVALKLGISVDELEGYIAAPKRYYFEYPNWDRQYVKLKTVQSRLQRILGTKVKGYS
jgi:N-acetyl sugar amidotransferase